MSYARTYERLLNESQYTFLLIDNSFIQLYFFWDKAGLKNARLAYYPVPVRITEDQQDLEEYIAETGIDILEEFYLGLSSWMELGIDVVNTSELRVDYDRDVESHAPCHLQLSSLNNIRIDFDRLINPLIFWDWILSQTLGESYSKIATKKDTGTLLQVFRKQTLIIPYNKRSTFLTSR